MIAEIILKEKDDFKYIMNEVFAIDPDSELRAFKDGGYKLIVKIYQEDVCRFLNLDKLLEERKDFAKAKDLEVKRRNKLIHKIPSWG